MRAAALATLGAAAVVALLALAAARHADLSDVEPFGRLHTSFAGSSAAIVAFALAVPAALALLLERDLSGRDEARVRS